MRRCLALATATALAAALAAASGCRVDPPACTGDLCAGEPGDDDLLGTIASHRDPVAAALRALASEDGLLSTDLDGLMDAVGQELGCDLASERHFVVLSNDGLIPKVVLTRCDDSAAASRFFAAVPYLRGDGDLDDRIVHLAAWDDSAARYRTYATHPGSDIEDGELVVDVEPSFCLGCHAGAATTRDGGAGWVPLMNEISEPWAGWHAGRDYPSQLFDELLAPEIASAPTYKELTAPDVLAPASELEPMIRGGIDRVNGARIAEHSPLSLLGPLFCDESLSYVSEVTGTGRLRQSAVIDAGLRDALVALYPESPWAWTASDELFVADGPERLDLIPTRGAAAVALEGELLERDLLSAEVALQIRAIDWRRPLASPFRCQLFHDGRGSVSAASDPDDAARQLLARAGIPAPTATSIIAVGDAGSPEFLDALAAGELEAYRVPPETLGQQVADHLKSASADRGGLDRRRQRLLCSVAARFPTAPIVPGVHCP